MRIRVLAVGQKMPDWIESGVDEYCRRLPSDFRIEWVEIKAAHRGSGSVEQYRRKEAQAIRAKMKQSDLVVALDINGIPLDTESIAEKLGNWRTLGRRLSLLIGGPDGLDRELMESASEKWSLGGITLPHHLVRIILAEQLYRAWSVLVGHPYHRGN